MTVHHGDCLDVMATMTDSSVDSIVTDPPYGLEFMGKGWDKLTGHGFTDRADRRPSPSWSRGSWQNKRCRKCGHIASGGSPCRCDEPVWEIELGKSTASARAAQEFHARWAEAAYRVAKPSSYLLAFGGTRTVHRMTVALEDAGWIIRDMLVWAYASGFPKSKASLKPAWEPIVMARKPGPLRMLAIDECRIGRVDGDRTEYGRDRTLPHANVTAALGHFDEVTPYETHPAGRWPANVILTDLTLGSGYSRFFEIPGGTSCDWCGAPTVVPSSSPSSQAVGSARSRAVIATDGLMGSTELLTDSRNTSAIETTSWLDDGESTPLTPRSRPLGTSPASEHQSSHAKFPVAASQGIAITTTTGVHSMCATCAALITSATTGASPEHRDYPWAFLIPKAARSDREPVLGGLPERELRTMGDGIGEYTRHAPGAIQRQNVHPTVKPVDLMRHLVRLVTPTGGTVLDPFLGSGTTALAAEMEGFEWVGIEREAEYVAIAEARLNGTQRGLGLPA